MDFKRQKFFVFGLSSSGRAVAEKLLSFGATVFVYDDGAPRIEKTVKYLTEKGCVSALSSPENFIRNADIVVLSPGVPIDNPLVVKAKRMGKRITGELELGYLFSRATFVAVTGTNGKTTTCSLINAALEAANEKTFLVGNIGVPLTAKSDEINACSYPVAVTEVSSFQIETLSSFTPHIAAVLNVTPDHLDRHYTFENYKFLKKKLLANLRESEYAVLNYDDEITKSFTKDARFNVIWFSTESEVDGAYIKGDEAYFFGEKIFDFKNFVLGGIHNRKNALAAIAVLKLLKVKNEDIARAFSTFKGVKHRIELIYTAGEVNYYNDSKATNVDSTLKAISALKKPTVLILGGYDKNQDFTPLFSALKGGFITHAVLTGASRFKMLSASENAGYKNISVTPSFESAIKIATIEAKEKNDVLLSPACASFDCFYDYAERGTEFERIVKSLYEN